MTQSAVSISVMSTVNAPYAVQMDGIGLAEALKSADIKKAQVGSFLTEVAPDLQNAFASEYKISKAELQLAAKVFSEWSGHETRR